MNKLQTNTAEDCTYFDCGDCKKGLPDTPCELSKCVAYTPKNDKMKTIEEKAQEAWMDYCYRADGSLYSTCFQDGYIQGATEALQSQWREFPTDKDGLADDDAIDKIAMPILVRYQDGYVFTVNYNWGEEAEWYNDILKHPNRYTWLPIPKYGAKGGGEK